MRYKTKKLKGNDMMGKDSMPEMIPCFSVTAKQMPELKSWEVGEKYQLVVDVVQTSRREDKDGNIDAGFDVVGYKHLPANDIEDMTDAEFEKEQAKGLSAHK